MPCGNEYFEVCNWDVISKKEKCGDDSKMQLTVRNNLYMVIITNSDNCSPMTSLVMLPLLLLLLLLCLGLILETAAVIVDI